MTTLEKISRYIAESRLTEKEIYQILFDFFKGRLDGAFVRGWVRRGNLARACKRASSSAAFKNSCLDEELLDYLDTDYTQPLSPETLVNIGEDIIEVKYLQKGDHIRLQNENFKVREVSWDGKKILLKF